MRNNISSYKIKILRNLPMLGVLVSCLLLTIFSCLLYERSARRHIVNLAAHDAIEYQRNLQQGVDDYIRLNRGVAGLFTASDDVTAKEFYAYVRSVQAFEAHSGLSYLGYIPRVENSRAARFEAAARDTFTSYRIHGEHGDAQYTYPMLYAYPHDANATQYAGTDFSGIPQAWEAMQKARDLGKSIATGKHAYFAKPGRKNMVFVFTPIYESDKPVETITQRRVALTGFVYSAFVIDEVIQDVMGAEFGNLFDLEIYDDAVRHENIVYDGDTQPHVLMEDKYPISHQERVDFAGKNWVLYFYPKPAYFRRHEARNHWLVLLSGVLISFALTCLAWKWRHHRRVRRLQHEHSQRFQAVFENHPSAVYSLDLQRRFVNANAKALKEFEISKARLIGSSVEQFIVPENAAKAQALFQEVLQGNAVSYDNAIVTGSGKRLDVSVVLIPVNIDGKISSVLGIAQNITERRQTEWRLEESRQMLQLVIDNIPQRVFWKNTELVFLGCNKAFCADAGVAHPGDIIGKSDQDLHWKSQADGYSRDDLETMRSGIAKINYEEPHLREDGSENWVRTSKIPLTNGEGRTVGVLGLYEDITERKVLEQKFRRMAHYDSLTGLPNRAYFYVQLEQAINRSKRHGSLLALMYFDIDKFKYINDTYGHDLGDAVIALFAKRVKNSVREVDVVGRLGGDEFALILEDLSDREAAPAVAAKLIEAMRPALSAREIALQVSTSIGIAFHEPDMAADELIRRADHAMYRAKQSGRNRFAMDSGTEYSPSASSSSF
jgi:diguanylate cyclase (GGDEF)-like protein/PAS domain S-box-containing protein